MADLKAFYQSSRAIQDGEWVTVGFDDANQFRIRLRGFTAKYRDALDTLRRKAARQANRGQRPGDVIYQPDSLPPSLDDKCQGEALAAHCILDVDGLIDKNDQVVSVAQFRDMLVDEEYRALLVLALNAAFRVGQDMQEDADAAVKNSVPVSAGT